MNDDFMKDNVLWISCALISIAVGLLTFGAEFASGGFLSSSNPTATRQKRASPNSSLLKMSASAAPVRRMVGKLDPSKTVMLLCDMQERFRPLIFRGESVVRTCKFLTSVSKALEIPVVATQQYTKVFGPTLEDCFEDASILGAPGGVPVFEKKLFSMLTPEVSEHLTTLNRSSYILFGIEAHVCVQQTALDLLELGHDVHVIVDGVSSQQAIDREVALQRLAGAGAYLTTAQSAAFMLLKSAEHPNFKPVSKLVVEHMKLPNEFNNALLPKSDDDK